MSNVMQAEIVLNALFTNAGLSKSFKTNPKTIQELVKTEFYLNDFAPAQAVLKPLMEKPMAIDGLLEAITRAIRTKHPALQDFLVEGQRENLFAEIEANKESVQRIIHRMVILQAVVRQMIASPQFSIELRQHFHKVCRSLGMRTSFWASVVDVYKATGDAFETAKVLTMDQVVGHYEELRTAGDFWKSQLRKRNKGLFANMFEATAADYVRGFRDNALGGFALNMSLINRMEVTGSNLAVKLHMDDGWMPLYEAWNLAFCAGKVGNVDLLIGKLLIPEVIGADDEDYLFNRGLALWVSAYLVLFYRLNGGGKDPKVTPAMEKIARKLALVNRPYVEAFSKRHKGISVTHAVVSRYIRKAIDTYVRR